ncbi:ABC transporter ATP-binding protein [Oceaniglobus trochenteri]|uniref:ABC transporter ATP-binding protein n=1 Tax=Oceaniglobus trochenteri TaxID=2763260 RepID=UPI001CFF8AFA|nr:sn-glycerol-3-phosphate ABC transporter ATP-binding protein UgpC [Oceaniglobus trochenteri]
MAELELSNVSKRYGGLLVVPDISLSVGDGEFVALVGPSGCGKSTTLRMIAGLEEISGGTISINGRVVNDLEPDERGIAMVFQSYALYPHMSVAKNMSFALRVAGRPREEIDSRVNEAARILGLTEFLNRRPAALSGGQRQRVAMGRAIVRRPDVFLFDEPLSNLDAKLRVQMRTEIKRIHQNVGATTIYVTHDQIEAMTLADRVVVMNNGRIEQVGTPAEVYASPATSFVAEFIGMPPMNLVGADVEGDALVLDGGTRLPLPETLRTLPASHDKVLLGLRPEDIAPAGHGLDMAAPWSLDVPVSISEPLGAETLLFFELAGKEWTARMLSPRPVAPGERLSFNFDLSKLHVFDAADGARIN